MLLNGIEINSKYAETIFTERKEKITTTKLRNLMAPINYLYSKVQQELETNLSKDVIDELEYIKIRFIYEAGREADVKIFIEKAKLNEYIDEVMKKSDKKTFLEFCRYFESLVAYAKYYEKKE